MNFPHSVSSAFPDSYHPNRLDRTSDAVLSEAQIQPSLIRAVLAQPSRISLCSFRELLQLQNSFSSMRPNPVIDPLYQQVFTELQSRRSQYETLQSRLNQNLQQIQGLNPDLYDRVFAKVDFQFLLNRVLDGDAIAIQQELMSHQAAIQQFYEDLTLRQLAPIVCQTRRILQRTKQIERVYEYLPVFSLVLVTFFLRFWFTWSWALIGAMFLVGPLMIWVAYPRRCELRAWVEQTRHDRQKTLDQNWCSLNTQKDQILQLLFVTSDELIIESSS